MDRIIFLVVGTHQLTLSSLTYFTGDPGAGGGLSRKAAGKLIEEPLAELERYITETFLPTLRKAIATHPAEPVGDEWSLEIQTDDLQP